MPEPTTKTTPAGPEVEPNIDPDMEEEAADQAAAAKSKGSLRARIRNSRLGTVGVVAVVAALILGGTYLVNHLTKDDTPSSGEASGKISEVELTGDTKGAPPKVGQQAPEFTATTYNGEEFSLAGAKGKPVWLVFNATWCSTCRAEIPDIQAAKEAFGDDVEVVAVYMSESVGVVANYSQTLGLDYLQIPDPKTEIGSAYRVMGIPAHYFIDADGVIKAIDVGALGEKQMESRLGEISGVAVTK